MFESDLEKTIILTAIAIWFVSSWYLNERFRRLDEKLDRTLEALLENIDGLRDYLYEIDPQFDDERNLISDLHESLENDTVTFAGMSHMELIKKKQSAPIPWFQVMSDLMLHIWQMVQNILVIMDRSALMI